MERRDFLKLSGTVTAGLALAPIDVIEGMAVASTTAFFVFTLQWHNYRETSRLQLHRYQIDALDEEDARTKVMALIPNGEGKVFRKVTKVADALPGWVG